MEHPHIYFRPGGYDRYAQPTVDRIRNLLGQRLASCPRRTCVSEPIVALGIVEKERIGKLIVTVAFSSDFKICTVAFTIGLELGKRGEIRYSLRSKVIISLPPFDGYLRVYAVGSKIRVGIKAGKHVLGFFPTATRVISDNQKTMIPIRSIATGSCKVGV